MAKNYDKCCGPMEGRAGLVMADAAIFYCLSIYYIVILRYAGLHPDYYVKLE